MQMNRMTAMVAVFALACVIMTRAHGEESKEKQMQRKINMSAPASESGNIYARGMSAILSYLGNDVNYDRVMGLTGVAFILQVDTSGPYLPDNELDCAWWPNDDWGFELGLPVLAKAVGWELHKLPSDMKTYKANPAAEYRRMFASAVEQSLRAGKPVLAAGFIGTGTDGQEPPLLGYATRGKSTQYGQQTVRIERYPWFLYVIGEKTPASSAADVDLASLRHIITLFNEKAQGADAPKTRFSGRQAWTEWLRLLRSESACDNNMLIHLRYNRRSAVTYLRDMAGRHTGKMAEHLNASADFYQRSLDDLMEMELPSLSLMKGGAAADAARAGYTAMIERVFKLEIQAITELEAAVASISNNP